MRQADGRFRFAGRVDPVLIWDSDLSSSRRAGRQATRRPERGVDGRLRVGAAACPRRPRRPVRVLVPALDVRVIDAGIRQRHQEVRSGAVRGPQLQQLPYRRPAGGGAAAGQLGREREELPHREGAVEPVGRAGRAGRGLPGPEAGRDVAAGKQRRALVARLACCGGEDAAEQPRGEHRLVVAFIVHEVLAAPVAAFSTGSGTLVGGTGLARCCRARIVMMMVVVDDDAAAEQVVVGFRNTVSEEGRSRDLAGYHNGLAQRNVGCTAKQGKGDVVVVGA